jgi:hypothetical protein
MLTAIPFSSDRAVLASYRGFRTIRLRPIAEDHTIGNVVADAGLLALVLERHVDQQARLSNRYRPAGFAGRRPLTAVL